jgi:chromosome segregation ATPase
MHSKLVITALFVAASVTPALAQSRGKGGKTGGLQIGAGGQQNQQAMQQQIQQIGQQLQEGERALQPAIEKANDARQDWQKADNAHKQNLRELTQSRKLAEEGAKNLPELISAKNKLEELRGQLAGVRKQVVETLTKENEEYQTVLKAHEAAVADQKANSGSGVSQDTRRDLVKRVSEAEKNKRTIEDVVMANNSEAKELNTQIKEAMLELAAASKKKTEYVETDAKLNSSKIAFQRTRDELKSAKSSLDQADGSANRIRSAMQALSNQRASLQNQLQTQQRMSQGANGNQGGNKGGNSYGNTRKK